MASDTGRVELYVPLLNANEPEALVTDVPVRIGQKVTAEDVVCILETTKASFEVPAESEGYIQEIRIHRGQTVAAGEVICVIGPEPAAARTTVQDVHGRA